MEKQIIDTYEYNNALKLKLNAEVDSLSNDEKTVLILHFGLSAEGYKTMDEIARILNVSKETVRELECSALSKIEPIEKSINEDIYSENERLKIILKPKIEKLPEDQKNVIILHFGLDGHTPKTINEIASILNLTNTKVKNLEIEALRNLRK